MIDIKKLKQYRDKVMERINHTDILISSIISQYYLPEFPVRMSFVSNVLYQQPLSFSSRVNILKNILKEKKQSNNKLINKLNEMSSIRNTFAHCELMIKFEGEEYYYNPKNYRKRIDFENEYEKFIKRDKEVNPVLMDLFKEFGGIFLK